MGRKTLGRIAEEGAIDATLYPYKKAFRIACVAMFGAWSTRSKTSEESIFYWAMSNKAPFQEAVREAMQDGPLMPGNESVPTMDGPEKQGSVPQIDSGIGGSVTSNDVKTDIVRGLRREEFRRHLEEAKATHEMQTDIEVRGKKRPASEEEKSLLEEVLDVAADVIKGREVDQGEVQVSNNAINRAEASALKNLVQDVVGDAADLLTKNKELQQQRDTPAHPANVLRNALESSGQGPMFAKKSQLKPLNTPEPARKEAEAKRKIADQEVNRLGK